MNPDSKTSSLMWKLLAHRPLALLLAMVDAYTPYQALSRQVFDCAMPPSDWCVPAQLFRHPTAADPPSLPRGTQLGLPEAQRLLKSARYWVTVQVWC